MYVVKVSSWVPFIQIFLSFRIKSHYKNVRKEPDLSL